MSGENDLQIQGDVDSSSIGNQGLTKKHWEDSFTSEKDQPVYDSNKHAEQESEWADGVDVNLKIRKQQWEQQGSLTTVQAADEEVVEEEYESAIDREVRFALEREKKLKEEQEGRIQTVQKEITVVQQKKESEKKQQQPMPITKVPPPQRVIASYSSSDYQSPAEVVNSTTYREMTEADRGSEMWKRESIIEREIREQQEREEMLRREGNIRLRAGSLNKEQEQSEYERQEKEEECISAHESIIDREIRLQREKEEAIERERTRKEGRFSASYRSAPAVQKPPPTSINTKPPRMEEVISPTEEVEIIQPRQSLPQVQYKDPFLTGHATSNRPVESIIARELREMKEREDEFRSVHKSIGMEIPERDHTDSMQTPASSSSVYNVHAAPPPVTEQPPPPMPQEEHVPVHKSPSIDSNLSTTSTSSSMDNITKARESRLKVQPWQEPDRDDTPKITLRNETPVEREIRLARERDEERRREKGLPPIEPSPDTNEDIEVTVQSSKPSSILFRKGEEDSERGTMKKMATNRLQKEIEKEKRREMMLRQEGKISTTSEERVGEPMKYVEVIPPEGTSIDILQKPKAITPNRTGHRPIVGIIENNHKASLPSSQPPIQKPVVTPSQEKTIQIVSNESIQNGNVNEHEHTQPKKKKVPTATLR